MSGHFDFDGEVLYFANCDINLKNSLIFKDYNEWYEFMIDLKETDTHVYFEKDSREIFFCFPGEVLIYIAAKNEKLYLRYYDYHNAPPMPFDEKALIRDLKKLIQDDLQSRNNVTKKTS